jgi:hypothetical protein
MRLIQGAWEIRDEEDSLESNILYISPDGRFVQFFSTGEYKRKPVPLYLYCTHEKGDMYRLKARRDAPGGLIEMRREGGNLVIVAWGETVVWSPLGEELPQMYKDILEEIVWK